MTDLDELLKERIAALKLERDRATAALERIKAQAAPPTTLQPEAIERFGRLMRESVTTGDIPFRKAYIQSVVDRVEVDDDLIRIIGDKATLEQAIAGTAARNLGVRSFERKWRARKDSNSFMEKGASKFYRRR
ncbi:MAG: hypothetical protein GY873_17215 [Bosea sp.]|uniref:hypothetical protein n=1 Tax=Bosea sp. (in: a-proteobacteria) TaxID=1871050 RepID=UPI00239262B0|nr:hypothetical protein [Bosea sp. (in: a-proteobacteria)]MCP4735928.1 hypothetical protein [Bosea sp. (in: a-proteobacteria)]